MLQKRANNT